MTRKEWKRAGRHSLKTHYFVFLAISLIGLFLSTDFASRLKGSRTDPYDSAIVTATVEEEPESEEDSSFKVEVSPDFKTADAVRVAANLIGGPRGIYDAAIDLLESGTLSSQEFSERLKSGNVAESNDPIFGRKRGVFASAVNSYTSGAVVVKLASLLNRFIKKDAASILLIILAASIIKSLIWALTTNAFRAIKARLYLESRIYEKIPLHRFLYALRQKTWLRTAWILAVESFYSMLWNVTIIGGIIKYFSYFMVPYITAENPKMKANEVITLSRRMMNGHKWECFKLMLSFIGWHLISGFTLGILDLAFLDPYIEATLAEYAAYIRTLAKENGIENADALNDVYLFEKADPGVLSDAYAVVLAKTASAKRFVDKRKGFRKFLSDFFGVILIDTAAEMSYQNHQADLDRFLVYKNASEGLAYPVRLAPIPDSTSYSTKPEVRYTRAYSIWSLIMIFFTMSFVGWLWEVSIHIVQDGVFVNRGMLHGPWLPIYGYGVVLILLLLYRLRKSPVAEFTAAIALCGCVEYFTSYFMEIAHDGQKWWDYTGYFLNLNGRICAEGLLVFGIGGATAVYFLAPNLDHFFSKISRKILIPIAIVLLVLFNADSIYSAKHPNTGEGITDYTDPADVTEENAQGLPEELSSSVDELIGSAA